MVALVTAAVSVVAVVVDDGCLVTIVVLIVDKLAVCGTLKIVFLTVSLLTVALLTMAGGLASLSESDRSELLKLLLPLPSVFLATITVGVATGCCCFTIGSGILTSKEDGVEVTGV